jgi:hypothetical protein
MKKKHTPGRPAAVVIRSGGGGMVVVTLVVLSLAGACIWLARKQPAAPSAPVIVEQEMVEKIAILQPPPADVPEPETETEPEPEPIVEETPPVIVAVEPEPAIAVEEKADDHPFQNEKPLVLLGIDATTTAERTRDAELITRALEKSAWVFYRDFLERSLRQAVAVANLANSRDGHERILKEPVFYQAFLRWQILHRHLVATTRSDNRDTGGFYAWLMTRNPLMEEMLLTIQTGDDLTGVIDILHQVWYPDAAGAEEYFNLALACAVVFDREIKIAHLPKSEEHGQSVVIDPLERFRWYVDKDKKGKLAAPMTRTSARDLVWVVSAPVTNAELDWAISKMSLRRHSWGNAYGMVEYLMERAVEGENPYTEYTFAQILKEGGICGDQSYFCAYTARANGIPAMIFSGETDLGPHAWVGMKIKPDEWSTLIGRVGGVSNGTTGNPQAGGTTSEQEVWLWNERAQRSEATTLAVMRNLWLADFFEKDGVDPALAEAAIRKAHQLGRSFPVTWQRLQDLLADKTRAAKDPGDKPIVDMWIRHVSEMRAEFRENPRMAGLASKAEDEFIFPHAEEADARKTLARERRRMERDAGEQKDLIATSLRREAELIISKEDPEALLKVSRLYDRALREYGASITGFKMMAEDYFGFVKKDEKLAPKAVRDIELAFKRVVETGSKDWFRANTESSIHKMICAYYREVGDESRADFLEKRYQRLLRAAERGAL